MNKADKNRARTDQERIDLIRYWSQWLYDHSNTYNGALGRELAYLWPAIARADQIAVTTGHSIYQLLKRYNPTEDWPIWDYIDVEGK
jgi:hypothetical protein